MPRLIDLTGRQFGSRTVLARAEENGACGQVRWRYVCTCGTVGIAGSQAVRASKRCVVCNDKSRLRPLEARYNHLVFQARKRGIACSLTYDDYVAIARYPSCHYCGSALCWHPFVRGGHSRVGGSASNLDRADNSRGYERGNVVPCCARCNQAKSYFFTYDEWRRIGALIRSWHWLNL